MVKRCPPSDSGSSSDYELKPDISDEDNEKDFKDSKSPQKKVQKKKSEESPLKIPVSSPLTADRDGRYRADDKAHTKRVWTPEEEKIFLEIMSKLVKTKMWDAVKDDGI
jgi:hypothetical protein